MVFSQRGPLQLDEGCVRVDRLVSVNQELAGGNVVRAIYGVDVIPGAGILEEAARDGRAKKNK